ncbi:MAG TPA: hypothetical protein VF720_12700 [Candidatus Eisenbacteria bacterium]
MKRTKLSILALLAVTTLTLPALLLAQKESEIQSVRADLQADRQAVVAANLPMTEAESAAFWPVYREYRAEMAVVGDGLQKLITDYAATYNKSAMTDEQGMMMTKEYLKLRKESLSIREKYVGKFGKIIPGKSVMRLYQVENKLDVVVDASLAGNIPLAE